MSDVSGLYVTEIGIKTLNMFHGCGVRKLISFYILQGLILGVCSFISFKFSEVFPAVQTSTGGYSLNNN
jgi:hypothetical protein